MHNPITTQFQWVALHQVCHKKRNHQTMRERINIEVDNLTRLALANGVGEEDLISSDFPFEQVRLKLDGCKVTGSP